MNLEQKREVVKKEEVSLPAGEVKAAETRRLHLHQPLLLGQPDLGAAERRWREGRQVVPGEPEEKAGQGGWRRQVEPGLAMLFLAPVCDPPQAGVWVLTLSTLTSSASVPSSGLCLEWRIPKIVFKSIHSNSIY